MTDANDGTTRARATLADVARATGAELSGDGGAIVADVTHDSRQAQADWLFVAIRGERFDANRFVAEVMRQGAAGVVSELERPADFDGAWLRVSDARAALAVAAAAVHRHPSRELKLVGITGTNGKTTTAHLVAAVVEAAGERAAVMGTVGYRIGDETFDAVHTTPESSEVQRFLRRAVDAGCRVAVMESSSQALDLRRCDALSVAVAVFTNLTQDHLDDHGTMENYYDSKRRLFDGRTGARPAVSAVNTDDPYGALLAEEIERDGGRVLRYSLGAGVGAGAKVSAREAAGAAAPVGRAAGAEVFAREVEFSLAGNSFELVTPAGTRRVRSPLVGRPHVYNALAAAATGHALGYSLETIARAIETCAGAPGRFERVAHAGDFTVAVDYAHTDDALRNVLSSARDIAADGARIITVFGCGGDRDRTKRAPMGEAAARHSDIVILTSDNPRTEDPESILADAEVGLRRVGKPYLKFVERREAIRRAIREARTGDVVVIAGKGHETYQIIGTVSHHFDDREVAREALAERGL
jgi:UDP-N-acetylmuramoyl-L-alanyl-D-glutamate--2,6-diaminopimelate ligase